MQLTREAVTAALTQVVEPTFPRVQVCLTKVYYCVIVSTSFVLHFYLNAPNDVYFQAKTKLQGIDKVLADKVFSQKVKLLVVGGVAHDPVLANLLVTKFLQELVKFSSLPPSSSFVLPLVLLFLLTSTSLMILFHMFHSCIC